MENLKQYRRGDIVYVYLNEEATGTEGRGGRPAIVVSNDHINERSGFLEVVYLTSKEKRPLATHVHIWTDRSSTALCEQVHTITKERVGDIIMTCSEVEMAEVDKALMDSLALKNTGIPRTLGGFRDRQVELELEDLKKQNATLVAERNRLIQKMQEMIDTATYIRKEQECEMYKAQFERLLDKMTGGTR